MGYGREISWSCTRARAFRECPRSAWYAYYSEGESHAQRAALLRQLVTLPMAVGAAVDYVIARAARAYRDDGIVLAGLGSVGLRLLRRQVSTSQAVAQGIRDGGSWRPSKGAWMPPLHHHVYGYDLGARYEAAMENRLARCLETFEGSEVWSALRGAGAGAWHPLVRLGECSTPFIVVDRSAKAWTNIDFALRRLDHAVVLDWKTGRESPQALVAARAQLIAYAVWACRHFAVSPENVRVQAVWLQGDARWRPEAVGRDEMRREALRMRADLAAERELVDTQWNAQGRVLRVHGAAQNFPTRPSSRTCLPCRFRELCLEGQEACRHVSSPVRT